MVFASSFSHQLCNFFIIRWTLEDLRQNRVAEAVRPKQMGGVYFSTVIEGVHGPSLQ